MSRQSTQVRDLAGELAALRISLPPPALTRLEVYLGELQRWNRRMNLVGLGDAGRIRRELLAESLYLLELDPVEGRLLDIGSGAGFPGLALKLARPELEVTLLESSRRKCAFLKHVLRETGVGGVRVVAERLESWAANRAQAGGFDLITTRAVDVDRRLLREMGSLLRAGGRAVFYATAAGAEAIAALDQEQTWIWRSPSPIPWNQRHAILVGSIPVSL